MTQSNIDMEVREFEPFSFWRYERSKEVVQDLLKRIKHIKSSAWCSLDEYIVLYEIARGYHDDPDTKGYVVEYGTNRGASASVMARGLLDSSDEILFPVFTIDPFHKEYWGDNAHRDSREVFTLLGLLHEYVCPMTSLSYEVQKWWNLPIRVLFVDAGHGYRSTKREIFDSLPFLVDKGWIICHDYEEEYLDVVRAVNAFLDSPDAEGIKIYFHSHRTIIMRIHKHER